MQSYSDEKQNNNPYHPGSNITVAEYPDNDLKGGQPSIPPPAYDGTSSTTSRDLRPSPQQQGQFASPAGPPTPQQPVYGGSYSAYPSPPPQSDSRGFQNPFSSHSPSPIPPATSSFARPPPGHLPYNAFPPAYLISHGRSLESGFDVMPPPSPMMPHPFGTHDVNEGDWNK